MIQSVENAHRKLILLTNRNTGIRLVYQEQYFRITVNGITTADARYLCGS